MRASSWRQGRVRGIPIHLYHYTIYHYDHSFLYLMTYLCIIPHLCRRIDAVLNLDLTIAITANPLLPATLSRVWTRWAALGPVLSLPGVAPSQCTQPARLLA